MIALKNQCPFCDQGYVGFFRLRSGQLVLWCDECESVWLTPAAVLSEPGMSANAPHDWQIRGTELTLEGGAWATEEEVAAAGFDSIETRRVVPLGHEEEA